MAFVACSDPSPLVLVVAAAVVVAAALVGMSRMSIWANRNLQLVTSLLLSFLPSSLLGGKHPVLVVLIMMIMMTMIVSSPCQTAIFQTTSTTTSRTFRYGSQRPPFGVIASEQHRDQLDIYYLWIVTTRTT
jgi:hypothetical protein